MKWRVQLDKKYIIEAETSLQINHHIEQSQKILIHVQKDAECRLHVTDRQVDGVDVEFHITLEQNAKLDIFVMIVQALQLQCKIYMYMQGLRAIADIKGVYVLSDKQQIDIKTYQYHCVADTKSSLVMKGMLQDASRMNYQGLIKIDKSAKRTYASQQNQNIVLSKDAKVVSVPSIEVLQHDVQCFHGSAIGKFDQQQLWYLQSKGLSYKAAYQLLVQSFFQEVLDGVENNQDVLRMLCQKINVA